MLKITLVNKRNESDCEEDKNAILKDLNHCDISNTVQEQALSLELSI